METLKNATEVKNVSDSKNLDAILKKYENVAVKSNATKNGLFKSNEHLKSVDGGKSFRKKMRKELRFFCLNVLTAKGEKRKEAKEKFLEHYKKFYALNDFSLASIYQGSTQHEIEFYTDFFEVLKSIK